MAVLGDHFQRPVTQISPRVIGRVHLFVADEAQPIGVVEQFDDEGGIVFAEGPDGQVFGVQRGQA